MNIEDYINSGVLMDYCLGLVTDEEREKIEKVCKEYPEIAAELMLFQNGLAKYAVKKTNWKNDELKNEIWDSIDKINKKENET